MAKKKDKRKYSPRQTKCEKRGFHEWTVIGVLASIPNEELELLCDDCGETGSATVEYDDHDKEDADETGED